MALEIIPIDFSSTIIGSAVSVVVVIISYVVYKIGIGEKSFEEVIEEQKRQKIEEELKLKLKSEKVKKEKKFKKTWGKKSKEKTELEVPTESVQVIEVKDAASDIEIIEPKETKSMKQKNKSKSASSQQAADTVQEKAKKPENSPVAEKHVQEKKKTPEVEKMKNEPKVEKVKNEPRVEKIKNEPKVEVSKQVEIKETVQSLPSSSVQTVSQSTAATHKKKKKEYVEKEAAPMTASRLLSMIKESELEAEEIQNLIDVLLNKQKDSSGWTKKNDTLAQTKKNLLEKEHLLDQEQRQSHDVKSKLKEVREECNALKAKLSTQEKHSQEKISRLQQDIQNLTARSKQVQDQLVAEREKSVQTDKENEKKMLATVKSLEDEKNALLLKISKLETELRSGTAKTEYETMKKSREDLQKVHTLLVEQHTQLVSKEKNLTAELSDIKIKAENLESLNKVLSTDCKTLKDSLASIDLARTTIEEKLEVEKKRSSELEVLQKKYSAQATEIVQLKAELNELKSENEGLAGQLLSTKERVAGDGQEILHQNGELNGKSQEIPAKLLDEKDKILKEKEFLLVELNDKLSKQQAKMTLLSEEVEVQKQKNNELREKNWKAIEALTNAEKNADQRIKDIQSTADQKIIALEKDIAASQLLSNSKSDSSSELSERLKRVENETAQKLEDYKKECEKNRQLSSEIDKIKELHKYRIAEVQKNVEDTKADISRCQLETKECLQRICLAVSIDNSLPFEKWLLEFERQATAITTATQSTMNTEELLKQKEREYSLKQTHYEQVLAETENTLLQLQKTAESQEILWQERLKTAEQELDKVKVERDALVTEKEAMQSTFQQIEELQEKLKLLQSTLESAENDRSQFEQKYDEVNKNCLNLRDQLENKEKQILELQKNSISLDSLNKEIEDLKSKLDKEKKINKDFSSQMVRLNSLVKIGQDALKSEQESVKKLKAQLEAAQVSTANGTASATSPVKVESQPKIRNAEKSKKRMDALDKK